MSTISQARRRVTYEQKRAAKIAEEQQRQTGYSRTPGFDAAAKPRQRYVPEAQRMGTPAESKPLGVSKGVISSAEEERRRQEKAKAGHVFTNADL